MPQRAALLTVMVSTVLSTLPIFLVGAFAPDIRWHFQLSETAFGAIASLYYFATAGWSVIGGRLTQRYGASFGMTGAAAGCVACLLGIVLASRLWLFVAAVAIGGAAAALSQPAGNLVLMHRIPGDRRGLAFGLKQASIPMAAMGSGLALPIVGVTLGWRWAFAIPVALALWILWAARRLGLRDDGSHRPAASGNVPGLMTMAVAGLLAASVGAGVNAFFVESAVQSGVQHATAGLWFFLAGLAGVVGRLLIGLRADRRYSSSGYLGTLASMLAMGAVGFLLLSSVTTWTGRIIATVIAFSAGWGWNGLYHLAVSLRAGEAAARATGITQTGMTMGGGVGPVMFGFIAQRWSFSTAWMGAAGMLALAAVLLLAMRFMSRADPADPGLVKD